MLLLVARPFTPRRSPLPPALISPRDLSLSLITRPPPPGVHVRAQSNLVTSVTTAGLVPLLSDPAVNLTLFAPTNQAFAGKLAASALLCGNNLTTYRCTTLAQLLASPYTLTALMTNHVLSSKTNVIRVANATTIQFVGGSIAVVRTWAGPRRQAAHRAGAGEGMGGALPTFLLLQHTTVLVSFSSRCLLACFARHPRRGWDRDRDLQTFLPCATSRTARLQTPTPPHNPR